MSMYPHRGMGGVPPGGNGASRLNELLDNIRSEFETQVRQCENYEHQSEHARPCRPEHHYPSRAQPLQPQLLTCVAVQTQVNEMQLVREKVYAMEQTHMALKQK